MTKRSIAGVALGVLGGVLLLAACSGSSVGVEPTPAANPTPASEPEASQTSDPPVMISIDALMRSGASEDQAECFVNAGDPDGTGFVTDVDAYLEAFGSCLLSDEAASAD